MSQTPQNPATDARPAAALTVAELHALFVTVVAEIAPQAPVSALLDQAELARELRTSTRTIRSLVRRGLPELRLADSPRYELEPVLEWLRARKQKAQ